MFSHHRLSWKLQNAFSLLRDRNVFLKNFTTLWLKNDSNTSKGNWNTQVFTLTQAVLFNLVETSNCTENSQILSVIFLGRGWGFMIRRSRQKLALRGQTVHFVNCKRIRNGPKIELLRNSQHCYFSLIGFAVLSSMDKLLKHCIALNCSKIRRNRQQILRNLHQSLRNPEQFVEPIYK